MYGGLPILPLGPMAVTTSFASVLLTIPVLGAVLAGSVLCRMLLHRRHRDG